MKTKAALLTAVGQPFVIESLDLAPPRQGEVLVKIGASGVCHSDYHLVTGDTRHPLPVVPGHEGAGVVVETGPDVTAVQPGDHVILNWAPYCGHCFYCRRDQTNLCATFVGPIWAGALLDGTTRLSRQGEPVYHFSGLATFAEYAVVPEASCVPVADDVPLPVAALIGCAVATGVGAALYTSPVRPGDSVAVYGCGGVGLNILQGAVLGGATTIIAVDSAPAKMTLARQFGATHTVPADDDTRATILDLTEGRGADHVFEAVGHPSVQEAALRAVRPGGTLVLVGLAPVSSKSVFSSAFITRQEKTIKGSYYGSVNTARDFPLLVDLYRHGRLQLDALVSRHYTLEQINHAYSNMLAGEEARGVVVFPA